MPDATPSLNPWVSVWTRPRATIRYLVETDPKRDVAVLAIVSAVAHVLIQALDSGLGEELSAAAVVAVAVIAGSIGGVITLYVGSWLLRWTGRWIGGRASAEELRTAMAWDAESASAAEKQNSVATHPGFLSLRAAVEKFLIATEAEFIPKEFQAGEPDLAERLERIRRGLLRYMLYRS